MKKYFTIILTFIGLISVSCKKTSTDIVKEYSVAYASIVDSDEGATKTSLDVATKKLSWAHNDKIYVVAADNETLWKLNEFNIVNSSIQGGSAEFGSAVDMSAGTYFVAFYGKRTNTMTDGLCMPTNTSYTTPNSYIQFVFPYNQPYCAAGPNPDYLLMRSTNESGNSLDNLEFDNMTSVMKIQVKDTRTSKATLSSIKVVSNILNEESKISISGRYYGNTINVKTVGTQLTDFKNYYSWKPVYNNTKGYTSIESGGTYGNAVLLSGINTSLTEVAQSFYIIVWPGDHGKISVTLTDTESNSKTYYMSSFESTKGKVHAFPVIDFGAN